MGRSIDDMTRNYRYSRHQFAPADAQDRVGRDGRRYRVAVARLQGVRGRVLDYLKHDGVAPGSYFAYLSCAQRLYRLGREQFCLTMAKEARVLVNYWVARGMSRPVLNGVCLTVLGFTPGDAGERPCAACGRRRGCGLAAE